MTEQERLAIVERIKKDLELQSLREKTKIKRKELIQNEKVKEYLETEKIIKKLNKELRLLKNEQQMIELEFIWALTGVKKSDIFQCNHDIWIYYGSYSLGETPWVELEFQVYNEEADDFSYNKYMCLECRKLIQVEDWQKFEKEEFVLKNRKENNPSKYQNLYYQLLYNYSVDESQRMVIEEFYKNKVLTKKKVNK